MSFPLEIDINLVFVAMRPKPIPGGSAAALTTMDGGNAENAGAFFGLLATVTATNTRLMSCKLLRRL